ncbi:uncharacterized protein B0P05DRAFT_571325 [Gilbertella persicaria]|uniref:uncharacterized protein n=1 Tax=Gilbertella persicaria TaxID=101096 RepID=UPI00221E4C84|nr:uncharacterized protein B0P05DRAFT_571325 [Gilbertella persicaria]KAI8080190.1 hypothetical protein B0P05DRAFT_571325 [Gilbertella persicaria]
MFLYYLFFLSLIFGIQAQTQPLSSQSLTPTPTLTITNSISSIITTTTTNTTNINTTTLVNQTLNSTSMINTTTATIMPNSTISFATITSFSPSLFTHFSDLFTHNVTGTNSSMSLKPTQSAPYPDDTIGKYGRLHISAATAFTPCFYYRIVAFLVLSVLF